MTGPSPCTELVRDLFEIACPQCGDDSKLRILIETWAPLSPDGTDANDGEHHWDRRSSCACDGCNYLGSVSDFSLTGEAVS